MLYMDVWGVREELYDLARRVATVGYYVMVPDFYYRQGKIRSTFINDKGERISLAGSARKTRPRCWSRRASSPTAWWSRTAARS